MAKSIITKAPKKLKLNHQDKKIAGVCSGIGDYLNTHPTVIRTVLLLGTLYWGVGLFAYVVFWSVMVETK